VLFSLVPTTPLPKVDNVASAAAGSAQAEHGPSERNGFTTSSTSHDTNSPPPEGTSSGTLYMDKKNKKKLSLGGSFTKFWRGSKKGKDNGEKFCCFHVVR